MQTNIAVNLINQTAQLTNTSWFDVVTVANELDACSHYLNVCQKHAAEKKWILLINAEEYSIEQLSVSKAIDPSRVLRVSANNLDKYLTKIESALSKGNCAAIVLNNAYIDNDVMAHLSLCAQQGRTQCLVIQSAQQLH